MGADFVIINEMIRRAGSDKAEFIELFDGGRGNTNLSGLLIVLYNGGDDRSYRTVDLAGLKTDSDGFAVIGNKGVAGIWVGVAGGVPAERCRCSCLVCRRAEFISEWNGRAYPDD